MITKGARRLRGINWETDTDIDTVLYLYIVYILCIYTI